MSWRQSTSAIRVGTEGSRAINIDATEADVRTICVKHGVAISAIETLPSGGTRVVLLNSEAAERIRTSFKAKLLKGKVIRTRWMPRR